MCVTYYRSSFIFYLVTSFFFCHKVDDMMYKFHCTFQRAMVVFLYEYMSLNNQA